MTFEIDVNGRTRSVTVERIGQGRYRLTVAGATHEVDAARVGNFGLSMLLDREAGLSREVLVTPATRRGELLVTIDGRIASAAVNARQTSRAGGDLAGSAAGEQAITAPMPGRVVRVLVTTGQDVAARQPLVVVEAMKMENELRAPRAGRVKDVQVAPGVSVEAGKVLVVIE